MSRWSTFVSTSQICMWLLGTSRVRGDLHIDTHTHTHLAALLSDRAPRRDRHRVSDEVSNSHAGLEDVMWRGQVTALVRMRLL